MEVLDKKMMAFRAKKRDHLLEAAIIQDNLLTRLSLPKMMETS
jgi:hypothetical protein